MKGKFPPWVKVEAVCLHSPLRGMALRTLLALPACYAEQGLFFVTVGLWCPCFCPSMGPAANALLDVCCCGPSGLDISIDRCSSGVQRVNAGSATLSAHVR